MRFEKVLQLSKAAAVELLNARREAELPDAATIEKVRKVLGDSKRTAATWLLAWIRLGTAPDAVMAEWNKFIDAEQELLRRSPNESSADIVAGLTRFRSFA